MQDHINPTNEQHAPLPSRLEREWKTIEAMISIYCRARHRRQNGLCHECSELLQYARHRLHCCPFQEEKPTCGNCLVHCYKPRMREKVREVMRFSGPRMIYRHPLMALRHLLDGRRKAPQPSRSKNSTGKTATPDTAQRRTGQ